jgi:hypothetical protein
MKTASQALAMRAQKIHYHTAMRTHGTPTIHYHTPCVYGTHGTVEHAMWTVRPGLPMRTNGAL